MTEATSDSDAPEPSPDTGSGAALPASAIASILLGFFAVAVVLRFSSADHPLGAAAKVIGAALAIGIVPGACVTLLWRPKPVLTLLELLGYGMAVSFGLVHLLTVTALVIHLSAGHGIYYDQWWPGSRLRRVLCGERASPQWLLPRSWLRSAPRII